METLWHSEMQIIKPEIEKSAMQEVFEAQSLVVSTREDYEIGQVYMSRLKNRVKMMTDERMAQTRPLDESKKRIIDFFRPHLEKLEAAINHLGSGMVKWTEEQEARRKEKERRLQEEARKRAEEEALRQALEAEQAGEKEEAEAILQEPVYVPPVKVASQIPKSKDSHIRETWSAELISLADLVKGINEGKAPLMAVKADMTFLNEQARAYKQSLTISGVRSISKKTQI